MLAEPKPSSLLSRMLRAEVEVARRAMAVAANSERISLYRGFLSVVRLVGLVSLGDGGEAEWNGQ